MEKIEKYNLPAEINTLYDKEASSAIGLCREVADKLNELIECYNSFSVEDVKWKQTQEGTIRKAIVYIKDNLYNTINEILKVTDLYTLVNADTRAEIIKRSEELQKQVNALASGAPIPVSGVNSMTDNSKIYLNKQDGKWYYSDGVAWIPGGLYQATAIGDNEVTTTKRTVSGDYGYLISEKGNITVDIDNLKITFNSDHVLVYRNNNATVKAQSIIIPANKPYMLYYDVNANQFIFHRPDNKTAGENAIYIGYISVVADGYVSLNANRYEVIKDYKKTIYNGGALIKPTRCADLLSGKVTINTHDETIDFTNAVYSLGYRYITLNTSIMYLQESSARIKYVVYDEKDNCAKVYENRNSENPEEVLLFAFYNGKLYHSYVNRHLYTIDGKAEGNANDKLCGKTATFIGDSITRGAGGSNPFTYYLAEQTSLTINNYGVDGSCVADKASETAQSFIDRIATYTGADIVGIMGGTNDYWNNVPLGNIEDSDTTTFYGAWNTLLKHMITTAPGAFIFGMTPPQAFRSAKRIAEGKATFPHPKNNLGLTFGDYCEAINKVCAKYAIPVLDLQNGSGMCPLIDSEDYRLYSDGLHPNNAGYEHIANIIKNYLENNYR